MTQPPTELAWRIGGPQGSGVDTAAGLFARACAQAGLHLFGRREYYSNIMGRHSYYDVRVAHRELVCHREQVDLLTTFDVESLARNSLAVALSCALLNDDPAYLIRAPTTIFQGRQDIIDMNSQWIPLASSVAIGRCR
jgi:2-oxoglutarate ferredoxin oxidoreductase subunit alpha